jgi:8-oxo-dGTP diphosphatase
LTKQFATAVILDEKIELVLLILREDFRIWGLPGGGLEVEETPEQAATREAYEETGYQVKIDRYVGKYHRPQFQDIRFIFRAHVIDGQALESGPETLAVKWFPIHELPKPLSPAVSEIIQDAVSCGDQPFERIQTLAWWKVIGIRFMIQLRNLRNRLSGRM